MQLQQMGLPRFKKDTKQIHPRNRLIQNAQKPFTHPQVFPNLYDFLSIVE